MKNISLPIFSFDGGPRFAIEPSNNEGRVRLIVMDTADKHWRAGDIIMSLPIELADDLSKAVVAFNAALRLAEVKP